MGRLDLQRRVGRNHWRRFYVSRLSIVLLAAGWKSFKAIESNDKGDDTTWLVFWFTYALLQFAKEVLDFGFKIVVPYYNETLVCLLVWLAFMGGATKVYDVVRPYLKGVETMVDEAELIATVATAQTLNAAADAVVEKLTEISSDMKQD